MTPQVRPATPEDAAELVRLRGLMFEAMSGKPDPGGWQPAAEQVLRERLAGPDDRRTMPAFVVDDPERPGRLAACAVGTLERRLPAPGHPDGLFGFVFNICTDPGHRRRGYARACTEALLAWFDARRVTRIDLHATEGGEALYRSLGFHEHSVPLSRQRLLQP
ncbi:ribosomal protein S18 acetylase RimI-like enzyme [Kitasatospora gansuensis]|uniref:Ribosomal protein S18 acetylase RimI-like enzyme n=1 Tax=Kitasatospora gansuensis TaxID=258050 RepID=A0A7W7SBX0_9ACTN|nr:GNAT family N-acetyltransferase [Kitasatospora gansuensis]MBB4947182.1 ribosomal protein S18 acetylase RimI-like enzyme [Kitasatospora gansuensis]